MGGNAMKLACGVATLIERYFTDRLIRQRNVSANTIASYRNTFRLLFTFAQARLRKPPSALTLNDLNAPFIGAFLTDLETKRGASAKTRNLRLTAAPTTACRCTASKPSSPISEPIAVGHHVSGRFGLNPNPRSQPRLVAAGGSTEHQPPHRRPAQAH